MLTSNQPINRQTCEEILERFASHITQLPSGCWVFTYQTDTNGYGLFYPGGLGCWSAHRFCWEVFIGPIPQDLLVCHRCDNPPCVRPTHLFLGTYADNSRDMVTKQRSNIGERNPHATLTEPQVREIKQRLAAGESQASLGRRFQVRDTAIAKIQHGERWAHVS